MSDQFSAKRFARGVRLTVQHVYDPLSDIKVDASNAEIIGTQESLGCCRATWVLPWAGPESAQAAATGTTNAPICYWPFVMPPFQQLFVRATLQDPHYPVILTELSLSIDTRAEPMAITGDRCAVSTPGLLTATDMNRYDMVLKLMERQPSVLTGDNIETTELLRLEIDGESAFGNEFSRPNPLLISDLSVQIKPFSVYFWQLECPGLYTASGTEDYLALVSLTLSAAFVSSLTNRDKVVDLSAPGIQNMPTSHNGAATGTTIALTTPSADAVITGTDVQTALHNFERPLRQGAASGYGMGYGATSDTMQAADHAPTELLDKDAHYMMIVVPLFSGQFQNSVRAADVATDGLPYTLAPWNLPTADQRVLPVPPNFVLHHAFAVWNNYSPPSALAGRAGWGTRCTRADYTQEVGIGISSAWHGDDDTIQQIGYLSWTGAAYTAFLLDEYIPDGNPRYALLQVPLVNPVAPLWDDNSWFQSGRPFFMGEGNNKTAPRTQCGAMPSAFGGGAFAPPATAGKENVLVVRWTKDDPVNGLNDPGQATAVRAGQGGEWVVLVGKQTVGA